MFPLKSSTYVLCSEKSKNIYNVWNVRWCRFCITNQHVASNVPLFTMFRPKTLLWRNKSMVIGKCKTRKNVIIEFSSHVPV